jgi:hypothetical protein
VPARRLAAVLLLLAAPAGTLAACGGEDPAPPPQRAVELTLEAPADAAVVDADAVEVRGRVVPATAGVRVLGREVDVRSGAFGVTVDLDEGANVIDVAAGAEGRLPVSTALRVVREVPVRVPDLEGLAPDEAVERLEALGLQAELRRGGGLLDGLLPGDAGVCATEPEAGEEVRPGTTVEVAVARAC